MIGEKLKLAGQFGAISGHEEEIGVDVSQDDAIDALLKLIFDADKAFFLPCSYMPKPSRAQDSFLVPKFSKHFS